jgi:hypothetical protein
MLFREINNFSISSRPKHDSCVVIGTVTATFVLSSSSSSAPAQLNSWLHLARSNLEAFEQQSRILGGDDDVFNYIGTGNGKALATKRAGICGVERSAFSMARCSVEFHHHKRVISVPASINVRVHPILVCACEMSVPVDPDVLVESPIDPFALVQNELPVIIKDERDNTDLSTE